jgi:2-keto-4-pentenoate hydratase
MQAGMVVITGSVITTVDIGVGDRLGFALDGVGEVSMVGA